MTIVLALAIVAVSPSTIAEEAPRFGPRKPPR
jgi:hypothetical protein